MTFAGSYFNVIANGNLYKEVLGDYNPDCTVVCAFALDFGVAAALNFNFAYFCRRLKLNGNFDVGVNFGLSLTAVAAAGFFRRSGLRSIKSFLYSMIFVLPSIYIYPVYTGYITFYAGTKKVTLIYFFTEKSEILKAAPDSLLLALGDFIAVVADFVFEFPAFEKVGDILRCNLRDVIQCVLCQIRLV